MKRTICCFFSLVTAISLFSQSQSANPFMNDANGKPLYLPTNYTQEGSPYFYDDYCIAEITSTSGKVYPNVKIKVNLQEKTVIYMTDSGDEMIATTPISSIKFSSVVYSGTAYEETILEGFNTPLNNAEGKIYQVLENGKNKLLKELSIVYNDTKKYGEATITRIFKRIETLFALFENTSELKKVENNKTAIISLFSIKQDLIKAYIDRQKLKCRSEADVIAIFRYFNSL